MKTKVSTIILLGFLILLHSCNGQDKENSKNKLNESKMIEKFDFEEYGKRESAVHTIVKNDTVIRMVFLDKNIATYVENPPKPSFKTIYKEFYSNGNIKKKEIFIGEKTKIDISEYYDENGNVEKVDENKKFGKIKPKDVLKFLENKKIINLSTSEGRFDENGNPSFEIQYSEKNNTYLITIVNGTPNTGPFDGMGEPLAFLPIIYQMDGETGKVEEVE